MRLLIIFCLISFSSFSQEALPVLFIESIDLDGSDNEWQHIVSYDFPTYDAAIWDVNGDFSGDTDLAISYQTAWNKEGLFFYITWEDDMIDERFIPKDSSTIKTSSGRRMDRMYLYDNLKIQIRHEGLNYSSWFSPRENGLQWHALRERKDGKSTTLQSSKPKFKCIKRTGNGYSIEVKVAWEDMHMSPTMELNVLVLFNDADLAQTNLKTRLQSPRAFISQSRKIKFQR